MLIHPEPLTQEAFTPFGEVIQAKGHSPVLINQGHTEKFQDLANLFAGEGGRMAVHIYRSKPVACPVLIHGLERHPLGSQAFFPLHNRPFPVLVAPNAVKPDVAGIRLFLTDGTQGFNLKPGVWHHYQMSLETESDYLVIDRMGNGANLEEYQLQEPLSLAL